MKSTRQVIGVKMWAVLFYAILFTSAISLPRNTYADSQQQSLKDAEQVLSFIHESAVTLCGEVSNSGHSSETNIKADAEATINKLFRKFLGVSVSMEGQLTTSNYVGVLQKDLAENYKDNAACKKNIVHELTSLIVKLQASHPKYSNLEDQVAIMLNVNGDSGRT